MASTVSLTPDPARVITKFFVPGREDVGPGASRTGGVISRILHLTDDEVEAALGDLKTRFGDRHRRLDDIFDEHAELVRTFVDTGPQVSAARWRLLGAAFTHEYSIEGAAMTNPSVVPHPVQDDGTALRFVMSVRGIGEGHKSSIGFRTGRLRNDGSLAIDEPSPFVEMATGRPSVHHRSVFHASLEGMGDDFEHVGHFLSTLPPTFNDADLSAGLEVVAADVSLRHLGPETVVRIRELAKWSYEIEFDEQTEISERVLWPNTPAESHGMEDARFVQFTDDDGSRMYYATYTAFDGVHIAQQLLATKDFRQFYSSPIVGAAAAGKGLALFPRRVNGRYMALTRHDRETNGVASSEDLRHWASTQTLQIPEAPWEVLQLGNCGSPIETAEGWLVLTHGVGPMRTYAIGALLLDIDRPERVLARSVEPVIFPGPGGRDGYVPNVVYSCGALVHEDTLILPIGVADQRIEIATFDVPTLLSKLSPE